MNHVPIADAAKHNGPYTIPVPDDFARNSHLPTREAAALYGVSRDTVARWRKEHGATDTPKARIPWTKGEDDYLSANVKSQSWLEIGRKLDRTPNACKARALKLGLHSGRPKGWVVDRGPRYLDGKKAMGVADMAADFIRGYDRTPVYRVTKEGTPNPKANFWKYGYGSLVLTEAELLAKAERKGWSPDDWKRIAA